MLARYRVYTAQEPTEGGNPWVEMPEMNPVGRARLKNEATVPESYISIHDDGTPSFDDTQVEIDVYQVPADE